MKIKKGDNVLVIAGKDRGTKGVVLKAIPRRDMVVVEGVNKAVRHVKSRRRGESGQIVEKTMPIHVSNVALVDPKTNKPTRVGIVRENGKRVRIAKKSNTVVK